jgi:hypothetical protein
VSCSPSKRTAYPLRPDHQPADRARPPPQPVALGWPTRIRVDAGNPVRPASVPQLDPAGHSGTQRDLTPPPRSGETSMTCGNADQGDRLHRSRPPDGRSQASIPYKPLTSPDLAHRWPTETGNGLPDRSRTRRRPGIREHLDQA